MLRFRWWLKKNKNKKWVFPVDDGYGAWNHLKKSWNRFKWIQRVGPSGIPKENRLLFSLWKLLSSIGEGKKQGVKFQNLARERTEAEYTDNFINNICQQQLSYEIRCHRFNFKCRKLKKKNITPQNKN